MKDLRIYNKIIAGCSMCPSLITGLNSIYCERTGTLYNDCKVMKDCPLPSAFGFDKTDGVTCEEREMLTAAFTMNYHQHKEERLNESKVMEN